MRGAIAGVPDGACTAVVTSIQFRARFAQRVQNSVGAGFPNLDRVPHVISSLRILRPRKVKVIPPEELPDPSWLAPGLPDPEQQAFGETMLARYGFLVVPSAVSRQSWNLVFKPDMAAGSYELLRQESFRFDPRLHHERPNR